MTAPTLSDVETAAELIRPHVRRTPLLRATVDGRPLVLKLEHLQRTGSFKLRGALNALLSGDAPERVVTASGGNHGLGVATAAAILGLPATVYVPTSAPAGKVRRIEATGAEVIRHGAGYAEAAAAALAAARQPGTRHLHAYDDPAVIAGQGTMTVEILSDAPDTDAVVLAVGGGGLAAGAAAALGGRVPVVAVEPEGCPTLHTALAAGEPVDVAVDSGSAAASALGASRVGDLPFALLSSTPTRSVLVSDTELLAARDRLWEEFRLAVEPAAATPFAAWLAGRVDAETPCVVLCGANTDWAPAGN
ncbi:serine/threonine dehydratase [Streptoalloteichus hindustanus]|uniref:L-threonine ammonia-lyase n=1 Tax=Streptoalloteichus hindustanus TaxID=2017 RepID=A0A1M5GND0_STRHI|nr:serine/threonine dehydratase [Streptoalloteichus hindustanus]SHG05061.1 L-threonine ammonia-lyase [Streptoalloteichus hindustanus]